MKCRSGRRDSSAGKRQPSPQPALSPVASRRTRRDQALGGWSIPLPSRRGEEMCAGVTTDVRSGGAVWVRNWMTKNVWLTWHEQRWVVPVQPCSRSRGACSSPCGASCARWCAVMRWTLFSTSSPMPGTKVQSRTTDKQMDAQHFIRNKVETRSPTVKMRIRCRWPCRGSNGPCLIPWRLRLAPWMDTPSGSAFVLSDPSPPQSLKNR